jgi:predicted Zn-dependent protease
MKSLLIHSGIKTIIIMLLLVIGNSSVSAQLISAVPEFRTDFVPAAWYNMDSVPLSNVMSRFEKRQKILKEGNTKKAQDLIDEVYGEAITMVKRLDSLDLLMYNDTMSRYLHSVLNKIIASNAELKGKDYVLFTRRSAIPNATDWGEGVIFISLDLLARLPSESQVAYVLCHELAHDYKDHVVINIRKTIDLLTDKEYKKNLKKISKQEYNAFQAFDDFVNKVTYKRNSYSRKDEMTADSLGLMFYNNAAIWFEDIQNLMRFLLYRLFNEINYGTDYNVTINCNV